MNNVPVIATSAETGALGICHLKRLWSSALAVREGRQAGRPDEWHLDRMVIDALGISLTQAFRYLQVNAPAFEEFERWIVDTAGMPDAGRIARVNAAVRGTIPPEPACRWLQDIDSGTPVLSDDALENWQENGYVVLRRAVDGGACREAEQAIWQYVGANPDSPASWYETSLPGIMVDLIQHPALEVNRRAARIHKAFAQLWGTADLWVSADRCGFHVPQRSDRPFPGPDLHWDLDFDKPLAFGTQGILYLTDTPPEQGALTLVPGFHHRLSGWLQDLPGGADPQQQDLHGLGSVPIGGRAGDMIIWHQWLPHGSRPNLGERPRIVQYINMYPGKLP